MEENNPLISDDQKFRDSQGTISDDGKRVWVYPKKPSGRFHRWRSIVAVFLVAIFVGMPLIQVNGRPFMLFNIFEREFILFGVSFGPYDFYLFVLLMISTIVFIFLFTAIYGRVFCGWICPQTIFMEMVFRKIEYLIEGDARQQRKLNEMDWNGTKFMKKGSKFLIFYGLSFLISHIFLAYIIGLNELINVVTSPPSENFTGFIAIIIFSGVFYFIFGWFREQVCIVVCPYGRLQGVLLDQNSLAVTYDFVRGEPRGKIKRDAEERKEGDCVDCNLCVEVCPTGIDIRNGLQLECVNCTACIDACDSVMDKVKRPRGLIRYASLSNIKEKMPFHITPRIIVYTLLLVILIGVTSFLMVNRTDVEVNILRTPGMLYQDQPENKISNLYNFHIINKTFDTIPVELEITNLEGKIVILGDEPIVEPQEVYEGKFMLILEKDDLKLLKIPVDINIKANGEVFETINTVFLSHVKQ